jgi:CheY-like chemotaxis protein
MPVIETALPMVRRLAIVDDDPDTAEITSWQVQDAGYEPVVFPGRAVADPEELTSWVSLSAEGAICDHRLMARGFANFFGARVVSELFGEQHVPAILVTQYVDMDQDVSIRRWRRNIPVLLSRDEANAETIRHGIEMCMAELNGNIPSSRKPYRTLVYVDALGDESNEPIMDVIIPSWNNHHAVRLPQTLVPAEMQDNIRAGTWLFADVNIGARESQDLFFTDFEPAPEPSDNAFT